MSESSPRKHVAELHKWQQQTSEPALEPALPMIDTHHHLWDDRHRGRYLIHELVADTRDAGHNVIATVFMESGSMHRADGPAAMRSVGEVEFANGIAAMSASGLYGECRHCAGIIGAADLALGDQVEPVLEALIAAGNGRLRGIRFGTPWDGTDSAQLYGRRNTPRYQLRDPAVRKGLACVQALGLSFDAWMFYPQLPELAEVLRILPNINVIVDHSGGLLRMPLGTDNEAFAAWRSNMKELAQFANVSVKAGGYGQSYPGWSFPQRAVPASSEELATAWRPYVETCVELFGVERCMFESNFPADMITCSYGVLCNSMKRITQSWSATEKRAFYRGTAARVYRLDV